MLEPVYLMVFYDKNLNPAEQRVCPAVSLVPFQKVVPGAALVSPISGWARGESSLVFQAKPGW